MYHNGAVWKSPIIYYTIRRSGFEDTALKDDGGNPTGFEEWKKLRLGDSVPDASVAEFEKKELSDKNGAPLLRSLYGDTDATVTSARAKVRLGCAPCYRRRFGRGPRGGFHDFPGMGDG